MDCNVCFFNSLNRHQHLTHSAIWKPFFHSSQDLAFVISETYIKIFKITKESKIQTIRKAGGPCNVIPERDIFAHIRIDIHLPVSNHFMSN
jgi:hypothetical protein